MPKKKIVELELERHGGEKYTYINGEPYVLDKGKVNKKKGVVTCKLVPVKKAEHKKIVERLAKQLSKKVNVEEMMRQALFDSPFSDIVEMDKEMQKKKPKVRNNKGCFFLTVGKAKVHLRD